MISVNQLTYSYGRARPVLDHLDVQLQAGNIYGLLGSNGAGKTTLLKNLAGLLRPQKGECDAYGFTPGQRSPYFLQDMYYLPEEFYVPNLAIRSYVDLHKPFYPKFEAAQFYDYLEELDIQSHHKLGELSYGQKKKVLIAFALATHCRLVILDEPTNGLDIPSKSHFRKMLALAASGDHEKCFILSTHQVREVENLIDPILILEDGKIIFHQTLEAISQKLLFEISNDTGEDVLYSLPNLGGNKVVRINHQQKESKVDLELLFSAVMNNRTVVQQLFNN